MVKYIMVIYNYILSNIMFFKSKRSRTLIKYVDLIPSLMFFLTGKFSRPKEYSFRDETGLSKSLSILIPIFFS